MSVKKFIKRALYFLAWSCQPAALGLFVWTAADGISHGLDGGRIQRVLDKVAVSGGTLCVERGAKGRWGQGAILDLRIPPGPVVAKIPKKFLEKYRVKQTYVSYGTTYKRLDCPTGFRLVTRHSR